MTIAEWWDENKDSYLWSGGIQGIPWDEQHQHNRDAISDLVKCPFPQPHDPLGETGPFVPESTIGKEDA
jgi:hypothetical protein